MDSHKIKRPVITTKREEEKTKKKKPPLVLWELNNGGVNKARSQEIGLKCKSRAIPRAISLSTPTSPKQSPPASPRSPQEPSSRSIDGKRVAAVHSSAPSSPLSGSSSPPSPHSYRASSGRDDSATDWRRHSRQFLVGSRVADGLWPSIRGLSSSKSQFTSLLTDKTVSDMVKSSSTMQLKDTPIKGSNLNHRPNDPFDLQRPVPALELGAMPHRGRVGRSMDQSALSILLRGVSPSRKHTIQPSREIQNAIGDEMPTTSDDCSPSTSIERASSPASSIKMMHHPLPAPRIQRLPSPRKASLPPATSCRGTKSPSRVRPSKIFPSSSTPFGFGNMPASASHLEDAHQLQLLQNRYLQWRFVNATAERTMSLQKVSTEDDLYSTWLTTTKLMSSVATKNITIQHLKQEMKLGLLLKQQMEYLEEWVSFESEHSTSLSEITEALKSSIIRIPVTGRTRVDIRSIKNAINSAVDMMQAMSSSICHMLPNVEEAKYTISELGNVTAKEKSMLDECRDLLASMAALQVQEFSLRVHLLQSMQELLKSDPIHLR